MTVLYLQVRLIVDSLALIREALAMLFLPRGGAGGRVKIGG